MSSPVELNPDLQTYQAHVRRLVGDAVAEQLMDRAMLASQVDVAARRLADAAAERTELVEQVGTLTQQLRAATATVVAAPAVAASDDAEAPGDSR